jgi:hypothetical protein
MMKKYLIRVEDELWRSFKQCVTKDKTINEAIVELIKREVKDFGRKA